MPSPPRYAAFDSLRACMMLLGLVLHAALSYLSRPVPEWVIRDTSRHLAFDVLVAWIHTFRMPVFFVVAGFFAHLLYQRYGRWGFARNRGLRVGLVLVLSWFPLLAALWVVIEASRHPEDPGALATAIREIGGARFWSVVRLAHLWFLYYLLLFCGVVVVLPHQRLQGAAASLTRWTGAALHHPWRAALLLAVPLGALLATMPMGFLATPVHVWPIHGPVFAAYGLLFGFGWFLYACRDQLWQLQAPANAMTAAGTGTLLAALLFVQRHQTPPAAALIAVATWLLVLGTLGLFLRYANQESAATRYLSDASYFVYLAHLPVVFAGVLALQPLAWPAVLKFGVVVALSSGLLLGAYQLLVRHSWVGVLLNGRRPPVPPARHATHATREPHLASEPSGPSATPYP
jgi:glucans biosynthesis protein C